MADKKLGRREFLKLTAAAAAAAGLSHFEFLNFGGSNVALARHCEVLDPRDPDVCDDLSADVCIPESMDGGDPDLCSPDPGSVPSDMCPDDSPQGDGDNCNPGQEADVCVPGDDPDQCQPGQDPDVCMGDDAGDGDSCEPPADADICETPGDGQTDVQCSGPINDICFPAFPPDACQTPNGLPEQPDTCDPSSGDLDACEPNIDEPDVCVPGADPDVCPDTLGDADVCDPEGDPDECSPTWDPDQSDQPTPVTVTSLGAGPASKAWSALGGLAAIVGAAAFWLRRNLGDTESDSD